MKENPKVAVLTMAGLAEGFNKEQIIGLIMLRLNMFYDETKELVEISLKNIHKD